MVNVSIPRRYARALIDVAAETASVEKVLSQLETLSALMVNSPELRDLVTNPAYGRPDRLAVFDKLLAAEGGVEPALANLLKLLNDRNRLATLPDITRLYRDRADALAGRVRGNVATATPLPADLVKNLQETLQRATRRNVLLESKVDPSLLGGLRAQVGSVVYDGTLAGQLEHMRRTLKER